MKDLTALIMIFTSLLFTCCKSTDQVEPNQTALSVGVFGGSVSCGVGSEVAYENWERAFDVKVKTNGVGGMAFSTLTGNANICNQIARAQAFDVYVLWASTNDAVKATLGNINSDDIKTQNGGIRKAVKLIKEKNETAIIIFLTSLPRFDDIQYILPNFVAGQIAVCHDLNIPCIEQSAEIGINENNYTNYYVDFVHPNNFGYKVISDMQIPFLTKYLPLKKK